MMTRNIILKNKSNCLAYWHVNIHALTYAGIQIRGGKGFKPHKPYCDLAIKYVKKDGVFPP